MRDAFPALAEAADGSFGGASTWLNPLLLRANWLYAQAHSRQYMQRLNSTAGAAGEVWEGETRYRAEHPTLSVSARVNLSGGAPIAALQYWGADSAWHDFTGGVYTTAGDHWFGGSAEMTFSCAALSLPANGLLRVRLTVNSGSEGYMCWAVMVGWAGLTTWPDLVTFLDSPTVHPAADFNILRTMEEYLLDCAEQPAIATETFTTEWPGAAGSIARYGFRHSARTAWYAYVEVASLPVDGHVYLYLQNAGYPHSGSRIATLADITTNGEAAHTADLSALGLTLGTRYCVEVVATGSVPVTIHNLQTLDPAVVTREYLGAGYVHGNQPDASDLNAIKNDLNDMYPWSDRNSPVFFGHELQPVAIAATAGGVAYSERGFIVCHRWRYLRWRGAGVIESVDGLYEQSLSDTDPEGEPQVMDLDSLSWLAYGMQYRVKSKGSKTLKQAHEDYAP
ncbi:MAG: hypothetical protein ACYC5O_00875 [Anaerolineae bacterium]